MSQNLRDNPWLLYLAGFALICAGGLLLVGISDWRRRRRQERERRRIWGQS